MYSVIKCFFEESQATNRMAWIINHDTDPYPFYANKYLHFLNIQSINTNKEYCYKLCKYFNFLESIKQKHYLHATQEDIVSFLSYIAYGGKKILKDNISKVSPTTIKLYSTVISGFYGYLYKIGVPFDLYYRLEKIGDNKHSFLYGQRWNTTFTKFVIDKTNTTVKKKQKHIKWYSSEECESILENLNHYRDKAIFSLTCDGMRIDEVLSILFGDYDASQGVVIADRSKGRETGDTGRVVCLSQQSIRYIEEYLYNERAFVEEQLLSVGVLPSNYLFINLRHSKNFGMPVKYRNYLQILKNAAEHAGLDSKTIRTHSGRSTKAMELFKLQSQDPSLLSDQQITDMMGWSNINSAKPYKNARDKETALMNWKRLNDAKNNRRNNNLSNK